MMQFNHDEALDTPTDKEHIHTVSMYLSRDEQEQSSIVIGKYDT